jgi:thiol:disulfide interchange protein DsbD
VLALVGLGALPLEAPSPSPAVAGAATRDEPWRPYDLAAIERELQRGRPVFVDFTADWCITCKVNESIVLEDERVKGELGRLDVATFKADWTLHDDDIRQVLASFGKAGVPMYLLYRPGAPGDPRVLPELLTVDLVIDALREAAGAAGA